MSITPISSITHKGLIEAARNRRICLTLLGMDIKQVTNTKRYRLLTVRLLRDNQ